MKPLLVEVYLLKLISVQVFVYHFTHLQCIQQIMNKVLFCLVKVSSYKIHVIYSPKLPDCFVISFPVNYYTCCRLSSGAFQMKLLSGECHRTFLMIIKIGSDNNLLQQAIIRAKIYVAKWHHWAEISQVTLQLGKIKYYSTTPRHDQMWNVLTSPVIYYIHVTLKP